MRILIAPYAKKMREKDSPNPKNYPFAKELVALLEQNGHEITQIGCTGERSIAKNFLADLEHPAVLKILHTFDVVICVDSYGQHAAWEAQKKAIVLFGPSDPLIWGHKLHINLLKDRVYLRPFQFDMWESWPPNPDAFVKPEKVLEIIQREFPQQ